MRKHPIFFTFRFQKFKKFVPLPRFLRFSLHEVEIINNILTTYLLIK